MHSSRSVSQGDGSHAATSAPLSAMTLDHAPAWWEQASSHLPPPQPFAPHPHTASLSSLFSPAHLALTSQKGALSF